MPRYDPKDRVVLVTGGAGFIGSHLVEALVAGGARVRVLDDLSTGASENLAGLETVELLTGDVRDATDCARAMSGVDLAFHLAALGSVPRSLKDPSATISVNVAGTANVFAAARTAGIRRVVYASSSSVYGDAQALPKKEGEEGRPLSPYALSKAMNEELARMFHRCYGIELVGLRFFNVYGPRQRPDGPYAAVVPRFFDAYLSGRAPTIYGDGRQSRDFTFVGDAVEAALLAAGALGVDSSLGYNVAGGLSVSIRDLADAIRELVGGGPAPVHAAERPGDVRDSFADGSRSGRELGYEPRVGLAEGLERTAEHFRRTRIAA
jgi:nucleoside-diphosphate-sugar epimerase